MSRRTGTHCLGTAEATLGCRQYGVDMLDLKICNFMNEYVITNYKINYCFQLVNFDLESGFLDLYVTIYYTIFLLDFYIFTSL